MYKKREYTVERLDIKRQWHYNCPLNLCNKHDHKFTKQSTGNVQSTCKTEKKIWVVGRSHFFSENLEVHVAVVRVKCRKLHSSKIYADRIRKNLHQKYKNNTSVDLLHKFTLFLLDGFIAQLLKLFLHLQKQCRGFLQVVHGNARFRLTRVHLSALLFEDLKFN